MCSIDYPSDIVAWRPPVTKGSATEHVESEKEVNYIDVGLVTTIQARKHSGRLFSCMHTFES